MLVWTTVVTKDVEEDVVLVFHLQILHAVFHMRHHDEASRHNYLGTDERTRLQ